MKNAVRTHVECKTNLDPQAYHILREKETYAAFTGKLH